MKVRLKNRYFFNMVMGDYLKYYRYCLVDDMRFQANNIITLDESTKRIYEGYSFYKKDESDPIYDIWFWCEHLFDIIKEKDNKGNFLLEFR